MKRILKFVKTTAIGGLLVIVPFTVVLIVLSQLFYAIYGLGMKLSQTLPVQILDNTGVILLLVIGSIVGLCFVTGLVLQTRAGIGIKEVFNRHIAKKIPMYGAIRSLTQRFVGVDGNQFAPVEIDLYGSASRVLGFLVESLPDNRCTVFVPGAPVATIGNLYFVPQHDVYPLDTSTGNALTVITQWGVDAASLLGAAGRGSN